MDWASNKDASWGRLWGRPRPAESWRRWLGRGRSGLFCLGFGPHKPDKKKKMNGCYY